MGKEESSSHKHSSKHHKSKNSERDTERKHKKRRKHESEGDDARPRKHKHSKRDHDAGSRMDIVDYDEKDAKLWVESDIGMDGEKVLATDIPTAESLKITSTASTSSGDTPLPQPTGVESKLTRDEWMFLPTTSTIENAPSQSSQKVMELDNDSFTEDYGELSGGSRNMAGGVDFFSSLGTERQKKPKADRPDPEKPAISSRELNQDLKAGRPINFDEPPPPAPTNTPGGPGSQWRMMRLRRVYEAAEEEGLPVEQLGIDRFGSLQAFEEAKEERRILDQRQGKQPSTDDRHQERGRTDKPTHFSQDGERRMMFNDIGGSGGSSRSSSFRRPGGAPNAINEPVTPSPPSGLAKGPTNRRLDSLRLPSQANSPLAQSHTPVPTVMTPPTASGSKTRGLSPSSLNKLQAKVIRAKLMNLPNASKLEQEYEAEARRSQGIVEEGGVRTKLEVLPTLDARGKMYDVGHGKEDDSLRPGNRKKKEKFETHDRKTGEVVRINADDDEITLGEMLRQERMGAGMADQKNLDAQYAKAIMGDGKFQNDLDYIDDNAEKLGRQKMRSDAMKRQFAINDYKQTQKALASCNFCYGDNDSPPKAPVIAMGTRVYLSCTLTEELVNGHCLIVPIQHHLNMLEGDDDVWDETRNFMKCIMRMFAEQDKGVVFYETVLSFKKQKHTCIECVPVPWEQFDLLPGYFKESILASEAEWSQHRKLIDFAARPGGFRRAMVPNLPYFMVQFDHKGEKGYGHVIEGELNNQDEDGLDEGEKGGGDFPFYFAAEIIGNVLELETRKWRRPKRVENNGGRVKAFQRDYKRFDWTGML